MNLRDFRCPITACCSKPTPLLPPQFITFPLCRWQVRLQLASTGLLPHVRHTTVDWMSQLLVVMDEIEDPVALISVLLRVRPA